MAAEAAKAEVAYTGDQDDAAIEEEVMRLVKNQEILEVYDQEYDGEPEKVLGEGAYGKVWIGTRMEAEGDMEEGAQFAIKTIFDCDSEAQLGREVKVMMEANHTNLVKMHEVYQVPGDNIHLVMDLVKPMEDLEQSDLFEYIMSFGALKPDETAKLIYQVCDALKYLNDRGVIHRDLKPENILIGEDRFGRIRVTDYGLARIFPEGMGDKEAKAATANVGSSGYQAPETMNDYGEKTFYGKQCDIFSLGVIAYICCAANPPFGLGQAANTENIKTGRYEPMEGGPWDTIPGELKQLIADMLIVKQDDRITAVDIMKNPWILANI